MNPKDIVGAKKAPVALVPHALVLWAAPAAKNGAEKYGPFNWREHPVEVMTYVEAIQRHLAAFVDGQDNAEDTGIHHLSHVAAGLGILCDSISLGIAVDNRPPKGPAADILRDQDRSQDPVGLFLSAMKTAGDVRALEGLGKDDVVIKTEPWGAGDGTLVDMVYAAEHDPKR